jgi:Domain of unknown function (DUF4476)
MIHRLISLLFALFLLKVTLFAQQNARLTISTTGNIALLATIDGVNYTLPNMAQTWYNLQPGIFQVKVFQYQNRPGMDAGYKEVYNGTVKLVAGRHTELVVSRFGKVMFDENDIAPDNWATGIPGMPGSGWGNVNPTQVAVNANDFAEIKKSLEQERFPDDKLKLARVLFKNNGFTTGQISDLSAQFNFEDDKLQFLKLAYPACVDKGNYHILARLLKFSSDREALMDFIAKQ